jgi:catechol 2,3-dioxygenase-like lactoylglutathione lyase family enzyme
MVMPAYAQFTLVKVSGDSFNNPESQHKTEVETRHLFVGFDDDGRFFKWHEFPAAAGQTWDLPSPPTSGKPGRMACSPA